MKKFSLGYKDYLKAFLLVLIGGVIYGLQQVIPGWNIPEQFKLAISSFLAYLAKNFFTDDIKQAKKLLDSITAPPVQNTDEGGGGVIPDQAPVAEEEQNKNS